MIIKNNNGKTPLDECEDTSNAEIISLFSKYDLKQGDVLQNNSMILSYASFLFSFGRYIQMEH